MAYLDAGPLPGPTVYVVEHEDVGAVAVFSTRDRAQRFIGDDGTAYDRDSLSITALVVDE